MDQNTNATTTMTSYRGERQHVPTFQDLRTPVLPEMFFFFLPSTGTANIMNGFAPKLLLQLT